MSDKMSEQEMSDHESEHGDMEILAVVPERKVVTAQDCHSAFAKLMEGRDLGDLLRAVISRGGHKKAAEVLLMRCVDEADVLNAAVRLVLDLAGLHVDLSIEEADMQSIDNLYNRIDELANDHAHDLMDAPILTRSDRFAGVLVQMWFQATTMEMDIFKSMTYVITRLTDSRVRPVRHAAVATGLHIVEAVCNRLTSVKRSLDSCEQLLDGAKGRRRATLKETIKEHAAQHDGLRKVIQAILQKGLIRSDDISAPIRAECYGAIRRLSDAGSAMFVTSDTWSEYLKFGLADKDNAVRIRTLEVLETWFSQPQCYNNAKSILVAHNVGKFVYQCCQLGSPSVIRVAALKVVLHMLALDPQALDDESFTECAEFVWSSDKHVASAAATVVNTHALGEPLLSKLDCGDNIHNMKIMENQLRTLAEFMESYGEQEGKTLWFWNTRFYEAFYDKVACLSSWLAITNLILLGETPNSEISTNQSYKKSYILMLEAATKHAVTHAHRDETRAKRAVDAVHVVLKRIPEMLERWQSDSVMQMFVALTCKHLCTFAAENQNAAAAEIPSNLSKDLVKILQRQTEPKVLAAVAESLCHLAKFHEPAQKSLKEVIRGLHGDLLAANKEDPQFAFTETVAMSCARLAILSSFCNVCEAQGDLTLLRDVNHCLEKLSSRQERTMKKTPTMCTVSLITVAYQTIDHLIPRAEDGDEDLVEVQTLFMESCQCFANFHKDTCMYVFFISFAAYVMVFSTMQQVCDPNFKGTAWFQNISDQHAGDFKKRLREMLCNSSNDVVVKESRATIENEYTRPMTQEALFAAMVGDDLPKGFDREHHWIAGCVAVLADCLYLPMQVELAPCTLRYMSTCGKHVKASIVKLFKTLRSRSVECDFFSILMSIQVDLFKATNADQRNNRTRDFAQACMTALGVRLPSELNDTFSETIMAGSSYMNQKPGFKVAMEPWISKYDAIFKSSLVEKMAEMSNDAVPSIDKVLHRYKKRFRTEDPTSTAQKGKKRKAALAA